MGKINDVIKRANKIGTAIPAFNIPYIPMMEPVIKAVVEQDSFALIETAHIEWKKFGVNGPEEVCKEFKKLQDPCHVGLHLDHVPVIDEENNSVDYLEIVEKAVELGFQSVMVDGSRLKFDKNIKTTWEVVKLAHNAGIPCEAELGAVLGHEPGPLPSYEELFNSGRGFTDIDQAEKFVRETGCDWLSVAAGNIHGAVSEELRNQKKPEARLDIEHIKSLSGVTDTPLVLHGGSGVKRKYLMAAINEGISKVNVGTELRQAYVNTLNKTKNISDAQKAAYLKTTELIKDYFKISGIREKVS